MKQTFETGSYHDVMRHEFQDRRGFPPRLPGDVKERLETEHDWVLLVFARDERLRTAAAKVAHELEDVLGPWPNNRDSHGDLAALVELNVAKALSGQDYDRSRTGYLNWEVACRMLARL